MYCSDTLFGFTVGYGSGVAVWKDPDRMVQRRDGEKLGLLPRTEAESCGSAQDLPTPTSPSGE